MDVQININGVEGILKALENLPVATQKKILRPGLRKGANIIKKQASENVKSVVSDEATGFLSRNIVVRSLRARNKGDVRIAVAIRPGEVGNPRTGTRVGLYGSVLEYGKEGQPPRPWLRPAQRDKAQEAINALVATGQQKFNDMVNEAKR